MGEGTILDCYHPDGNIFFKRCADLHHLCDELKDPSKRISKENEVHLFQQCMPMLAMRKDFNQIPSFMGSEFILEEKFDGERMLVHRKMALNTTTGHFYLIFYIN